MNAIISVTHSGVRCSIIVAPSPNIMSMYFMSLSLESPAPGAGRLSPLGRSGRHILDTGRERI